MSQENVRDNVELHRRANEAFNRRDMDDFLRLADPDVEFTPFERAVEGLGPYRGHAGIRAWWEDIFAAMVDVRAELDEVRDLGEMTLAHGRLRGTGAASGAHFDRHIWQACKWRDGRCFWWCVFEREAEALQALGLGE